MTTFLYKNTLLGMIVEKVREFTKAANENLPGTPEAMDETQVDFLRKMVNDEFDELIDSLKIENNEEKIIAQYDALIDALYYIADGAVKRAFNLDPVFDVVHLANMRKVVDGKVVKDERGKVLKPEGWYGPEQEMRSTILNHIKNGSWK